MKKLPAHLVCAVFLAAGIALLRADASSAPAKKCRKMSPIALLRDHDAKVKKILDQSPGDTLSPALRARIKKEINEVFDFEELSRLALGKHWAERTPEERNHFVATFTGIVEEQNFDNFVRYYREGNIEYQEQTVEGDKAKVKGLIPLKREKVEIEYRMHLVDGCWKIYDLVIDGVSTAEGNRRRYARYIEKHSYPELVKRLDQQLARLRESND